MTESQSYLLDAIDIATELLNAIENDETPNETKLNLSLESKLYFDMRIEQLLDSLHQLPKV